MKNEPFTSIGILIGGPCCGISCHLMGDRVIYAEARPMRYLLVHSEEIIKDGIIRHVYQYSGSQFCGIENKQYRVFVYQGEDGPRGL